VLVVAACSVRISTRTPSPNKQRCMVGHPLSTDVLITDFIHYTFVCVCVCEYFIHYFGTQVLDRSTMTVASSMVTCERLFPTLIPNPTNGIRKRVGTTTSGPNTAATCSHASRPRLAFNVLLLCHDGYTSTLLATDTSTHH
jgi:hypothetical protein